jgi:predicted permease
MSRFPVVSPPLFDSGRNDPASGHGNSTTRRLLALYGQSRAGTGFSRWQAMLFLRNLRLGCRSLRRHPSFAASAVAVMSVGIGTTTAVFSVVRGVILTPLPYREPSRVVLFRVDLPAYRNQAALNREELFALQDRTDLFESVAVINESEGNLTAPDQMEAVPAASASDNFLETLGVTPLLGRTVSRKDVGRQWVDAVTISYELWQRQFQLDPKILGRQIEVNNLPMRVAGVLPKDFRLYLGPGVIAPRIDIWYPRPASYDTEDPFRGRIVIARLRGGLGIAAARRELDALAARLVVNHPSEYRNGALRLSMSSLDQEVVSEIKPALTALTAAVGFVLLVGCANLANLLLARASMRGREIAVRVSIGASRTHIVAQFACEALLVGALGAVGGLLIAYWCVDALLALAPASLPRRETVHVDLTVAAFAIALSLLCALVASLVPAWHVARTNAIAALKQDPASSPAANTMRGALAGGQLALSMVLVIAAGLLGRAFVSLRSVPLGFDPDRALTMNIALQGQRFNRGSLDEARLTRLAFYQQLADAVRQIPGVEQVGVGLPVPLKGISMVQRFSTGPGEPERQAEAIIAFAGYVDTLRVPLVAGRYFTRDDDNRPVAMIDERLAADVWPGHSPIGQRLLLSSASGGRPVEVIGVLSHIQSQGLRSAGLPQVWMTYASKAYSSLDIVIRGANPASFIAPVKETVQRLGAGRPVHDVRLLKEYVTDASADTRFALFVLGASGGFAMLLSALGLYAVIAYATARRTREIAIRLALGADAQRILRLVLRQGTVSVAAGIVVGIAGARIFARYLSTLLFEVTEADVITFAAVSALLAAVALAAMTMPALRAIRIDPTVALKAE